MDKEKWGQRGPCRVQKGNVVQRRCTFIEGPEAGMSPCRSTGPKVELTERNNNYAIASSSVQGKIKSVDVVEDY